MCIQLTSDFSRVKWVLDTFLRKWILLVYVVSFQRTTNNTHPGVNVINIHKSIFRKKLVYFMKDLKIFILYR